MGTVVAPPLPFDWDALRTPAWHERRARKRGVRAEFKRVRDIGLRRRHAVKLARIHAACSTNEDGTVHCAVDPRSNEQCPSRFWLIDTLDAPGVADPRTGQVIPDDEVEDLSREEFVAWVESLHRPLPAPITASAAATMPALMTATTAPTTTSAPSSAAQSPNPPDAAPRPLAQPGPPTQAPAPDPPDHTGPRPTARSRRRRDQPPHAERTPVTHHRRRDQGRASLRTRADSRCPRASARHQRHPRTPDRGRLLPTPLDTNRRT